jgi:hypothetical protein
MILGVKKHKKVKKILHYMSEHISRLHSVNIMSTTYSGKLCAWHSSFFHQCCVSAQLTSAYNSYEPEKFASAITLRQQPAPGPCVNLFASGKFTALGIKHVRQLITVNTMLQSLITCVTALNEMCQIPTQSSVHQFVLEGNDETFIQLIIHVLERMGTKTFSAAAQEFTSMSFNALEMYHAMMMQQEQQVSCLNDCVVVTIGDAVSSQLRAQFLLQERRISQSEYLHLRFTLPQRAPAFKNRTLILIENEAVVRECCLTRAESERLTDHIESGFVYYGQVKVYKVFNSTRPLDIAFSMLQLT